MKKIVLIYFVFLIQAYALSINEKILHLAENQISQSSYYSKCVNLGLVTPNNKAIRFQSFNGGKYLAFYTDNYKLIRKLFTKSLEDGEDGLLFKNPMESNQKILFDFNKENCNYIKKLTDMKFETMFQYVFSK